MISVKNVILHNKPLSNFELEDAVKKQNSVFQRSFLTRYITEKAK